MTGTVSGTHEEMSRVQSEFGVITNFHILKDE
jgi:hypothetical protein